LSLDFARLTKRPPSFSGKSGGCSIPAIVASKQVMDRLSNSVLLKRLLSSLLVLHVFFLSSVAVLAQSMGQEQIQEKNELNSMKSEMSDIKSTIDKTVNSLNDLAGQMSRQPDNEVHLIVKESRLEVVPGKFVAGLTYNGKFPGPTIRAREGAPLRVVLHNQSHRQTSLTFHGLLLPQSVSGLPHKNGGAVNPGQTYVYQFVPGQTGTFWYHPQVNHLYQKTMGLYGALVVEPATPHHNYDRDYVLMFSQVAARSDQTDKANPGKPNEAGLQSLRIGSKELTDVFYLINGMTGSSIQPIELRKGERIRLRLVNASAQVIPLSLTGHKLEVVSINGSDALEPHVFRDTLTLNPSDRVDADFTADNPGVWSLASEIPEQASNQGIFPGGIACVVRYLEFQAEQQ